MTAKPLETHNFNNLYRPTLGGKLKSPNPGTFIGNIY